MEENAFSLTPIINGAVLPAFNIVICFVAVVPKTALARKKWKSLSPGF